MSALKETIQEEISKREEKRIQEKNEKLKLKKETAQEEILKLLDERFNYNYFRLEKLGRTLDVPVERAKTIYNFEENAKKLGFECIKEYKYDAFNYHLYIPVENTDEMPTPAQQRYKELEEFIQVARTHRKIELLDECYRIKNRIIDGDYSYKILTNKRVQIMVISLKKVKLEYEEEIVHEFFDEYELEFKFYDIDNENWVFELNME